VCLTKSSRFFFETSWFHILGFSDWWQLQSSNIRLFLKGWGANLGKHTRGAKANLLAQIQELDSVADGLGLDEDGWALRYHLEAQMGDVEF
jgi:hypothetical protein